MIIEGNVYEVLYIEIKYLMPDISETISAIFSPFSLIPHP
jgi:hypothetical protein